jgi:SAM-dependent methyltransferase
LDNASCSPPDETIGWYEDKVRTYGYDHRGLGYGQRSSQERRFEALIELGDFDGRRILDVGCGFGDFLAFLHERGVEPRYTGIDVCAPMIDRCEERFAASGNRFLVADALSFEPDGPYDFVIASGLFGLEAEGARERIRPTLERLFGWCRTGMAANFLSARSPRPAQRRVYVEPAEILDLAFALTPAVRMDHTYLPNDFTIHLYKTPAWELGSTGRNT